jgi:hypothetical protein
MKIALNQNVGVRRSFEKRLSLIADDESRPGGQALKWREIGRGRIGGHQQGQGFHELSV